MSSLAYFTIWIRVHHRNSDLRQSLHLSIPARFWNKKRGWIKEPTDDPFIKERLDKTEAVLNNLKHQIYAHLLDTDEPLFYPFVQFDGHMYSAQNDLCIGIMWLVQTIRLQRPHRMLPNSTPKGIHVASELQEKENTPDYALTVRNACSGTDGTIFETIERITEVSPVE